MPASLFQGSLLLGGLARAVLGHAAAGAPALVHPALVAGWCGLVVSALNLLPVGSLDGGRMIQVTRALLLFALMMQNIVILSAAVPFACMAESCYL